MNGLPLLSSLRLSGVLGVFVLCKGLVYMFVCECGEER